MKASSVIDYSLFIKPVPAVATWTEVEGLVEYATMEEDELIRCAKEGDIDSFNQLVETYQRAVYNLCLRMLGNTPAAEDATQDAFISAFRGINRLRGGNFKAWLFRIAANACRDQLRSLRRRPITSLDDAPFEFKSDQPSPEDYAMRQELGEEIRKAFTTLSPDQRLAVILRDIEGLDYEEIAQVTGSSLGTVKSRINRGRTRLRLHLEKHRELFV